MTYIISGYNPRAGLRGGVLGDVWGDMMKDPVATATAQAQAAWTAASDAALMSVGLKAPPKAAKAAATPGIVLPNISDRLRLRPGLAPSSVGPMAYPPPEEKDNTMLYVGGAVALVAVLAMMRRK